MPRTNNYIYSMDVAGFQSIPLYAILILDVRAVFPFTVSGSTLTATGHTYVNGTQVKVSQSGGALPSPLNATNKYFVVSASGSTLQLSNTQGGSPITLTDAGSGTFTITDVALDSSMATPAFPSPAVYIPKEVPDYYGLGGRPSVTFASAPSLYTDPITVIESYRMLTSTALNNSGGGSDVLFNAIALIKDGSATRGDTSGVCVDYTPLGATVSVVAGQTDSFQSQVLSEIGV